MAQYSCKWNSHVPHLLGSMETLRGVDNFVDVTLVSAGGRQLKAHRLVLSTCSDMLHEMFLQHPSQHTVVVLADVPYPTLKQIVDFAYRGEVSFPEGELEPLLKAATALQIKTLTEVCREKWLTQAIDTPAEITTAPAKVQQKRSSKRKRPRRSSVESSSEDEGASKEETVTNDVVVMEVERPPDLTVRTTKEPSVVVQGASETVTVKNGKEDFQVKEALRSLCHTRQIKVKSSKNIDEPQDRRRSYVWTFFTPVDHAYATCKACGKNISRKSSISNLKKHLENKHGKIIMDTYSSEIIGPALIKEDQRTENEIESHENESHSQSEIQQATETIVSEAVVYEGSDQLYYVPTTQQSEPSQSMPIILKFQGV